MRPILVLAISTDIPKTATSLFSSRDLFPTESSHSIMVKPTLILRQFLPYDAVSTGNLVLDVRHPEQEFFTSEAGCISDKDVVTQHLENFS